MDKELLFKPRAATTSGLPEDDVEVPGIGTVRVRGLSRHEALKIRDYERIEGECLMLAFAMLDPVLTVDEAARWQNASAAMEIEPVTDKISELSGLTDGAAKEAVKEFVADPDAEFRALPSGEAELDSGSASDGDAER